MQSPEPSELMMGFSTEAGGPLTIVLAQQFFLERDALARVIAIALPPFVTIDATPENLDEVIVEVTPDVVICNTLTELTESRVPVWIHLNIDDSARSVISFHGERTEVMHLGLNGIVDTLGKAHYLRVLA